MKNIWMILSLAILLFPTFVSADCADLGKFTSWILETSYTMLFYAGEKPIARLQVPNCEIHRLSTIRLINSYVCDADEIMIDGVACHIISVELLH